MCEEPCSLAFTSLLQKMLIYTLHDLLPDSTKRPGESSTCQQSSGDWSCRQKLADCCCLVQLLTSKGQCAPFCVCTLSVQEKAGIQCLWCSHCQFQGCQVQLCASQGLCCMLRIWTFTMGACACENFSCTCACTQECVQMCVLAHTNAHTHTRIDCMCIHIQMYTHIYTN